MKCPCQSGLSFTDCCEPIHTSRKQAITAEALMRSRYSAFALANVDYLMKSQHPSTRKVKEKEMLKKWASSVQWVGLKIISKSEGLENDTQGLVEFKAMYLENGEIQFIEENSRFVRQNGNWFYVDGVHK